MEDSDSSQIGGICPHVCTNRKEWSCTCPSQHLVLNVNEDHDGKENTSREHVITIHGTETKHSVYQQKYFISTNGKLPPHWHHERVPNKGETGFSAVCVSLTNIDLSISALL